MKELPKDVLNPGCSSPLTQQFARGVEPKRPLPPASASAVNSNGQKQVIDRKPGQQGVTVTLGPPKPLGTFSAEAGRRQNICPSDSGVRVEIVSASGNPKNIKVANQNQSRLPVEDAVSLPTFRTYDGGRGGQVRGIPVDVIIK